MTLDEKLEWFIIIMIIVTNIITIKLRPFLIT